MQKFHQLRSAWKFSFILLCKGDSVYRQSDLEDVEWNFSSSGIEVNFRTRINFLI